MPLTQIIASYPTFAAAIASFDRIEAYMRLPRRDVDGGDARVVPDVVPPGVAGAVWTVGDALHVDAVGLHETGPSSSS